MRIIDPSGIIDSVYADEASTSDDDLVRLAVTHGQMAEVINDRFEGRWPNGTRRSTRIRPGRPRMPIGLERQDEDGYPLKEPD